MYIKIKDREKFEFYSNLYWKCTSQELIAFLEKCYIEKHFFIKVAKHTYQCTDGFQLTLEDDLKVGDMIYHPEHKMRYELKRINANPINYQHLNEHVNYLDVVNDKVIQWSFAYDRVLNKETKQYEITVDNHPFYLSEVDEKKPFRISYGIIGITSGISYNHKKEWRIPSKACRFDIRGYTLMHEDVLSKYPHTGYEKIQPKLTNLFSFREYLNIWEKYPTTEMYAKLGLISFISSYENHEDIINLNGKSFKQITGLDKTYMNVIQHRNYTPNFHRLVLLLNLSVEEIERFLRLELYHYYIVRFNALFNRNKHLRAYVPKTKYKKIFNYLIDNEISIESYSDVIEWLDELGYPFKNDYVFFQDKDEFNAFHDTLMKEYTKFKDQIYDKKIKKYYTQLSQYTFSNNEYIIEPFSSQEELIEESEQLHHCIRTYAEDYANQESELYKIRAINEKDKPLYSLEVKIGQVWQCRGKNNELPPQKIVKFYERWFEKIRKNGGIIDGTN